MNHLIYIEPQDGTLHEVWFSSGRYFAFTDYGDVVSKIRFKEGSGPHKVGWELVGEL